MNSDGIPVIFLSCVTREFGRYRPLIAARLKRCSIHSVFQEEFEYSESGTITKLYEYLNNCDVVVHFVGRGAGFPASPEAVQEFLQFLDHSALASIRRNEFLSKARELKIGVGQLSELTYTHWEALLALCLGKHFIPLKPRVVIRDGHPTDPPFQESALDQARQTRHLNWLREDAQKFPDELGSSPDGPWFEEIIDRVNGFLHRLEGKWSLAAKQLSMIQDSRRKIGQVSIGQLVKLLTQTHREALRIEEFLPTVAAQIVGDQFVTILYGDRLDHHGDLLTSFIERIMECPTQGTCRVILGLERLIVLALVSRHWAQTLGRNKAVDDLSIWIDTACDSTGMTVDAFTPQFNHIIATFSDNRIPLPIVQATFEPIAAATNSARRAARIVWGDATQNLTLGKEQIGVPEETVGVVEDSIYENHLEMFPYHCIELTIPKTSSCFSRWYNDAQVEPWARLLRIQRNRRELLRVIPPLQMPLDQAQIARCNSADFTNQAKQCGAFVATWDEVEPDWDLLATAVPQCRLGIWFETKQSQHVAELLLSQLNGLTSYDEILDRIKEIQKTHPGTRCVYEHPKHDPFSPRFESQMEQQNVLYLQ